jgi:hypothetical protein
MRGRRSRAEPEAAAAAEAVREELEPGAQRQYSLDDFELIRVIGRGSYAKVHTVRPPFQICLMPDLA